MEFPEAVKEGRALVEQLTREIRTTSYLLHPPLLDEVGLSSALRWYAQGVTERSGLQIDLKIADNLERLPRDLELVIFRLVQESLTNIHRHSGSKRALISIEREALYVRVSVQDEGKGISPERLAKIQSQGTGVGIRGMRERLRPFGGELQFESNGSGTKVSAVLPTNMPSSADQNTI